MGKVVGGRWSLVVGRSSLVVGQSGEDKIRITDEIRMTLEELENTLPNGLHDAEVKRISVDYEQRKLVLGISVWVGDMGEAPERREADKSGRIDISGLLFLVMEPPDGKYPFKAGNLRIDGSNVGNGLSRGLLDSIPSDSFLRSLWVTEWNVFIHIAAKDAQIIWNDSATVYRNRRVHSAPGDTIDL